MIDFMNKISQLLDLSDCRRTSAESSFFYFPASLYLTLLLIYILFVDVTAQTVSAKDQARLSEPIKELDILLTEVISVTRNQVMHHISI